MKGFTGNIALIRQYSMSLEWDSGRSSSARSA
jgi:hypothetical protein